MMRELRALSLLELRSLYGINRMLHTQDPKAKKRNLLMLAAWILLIACCIFYMVMLVYGLTVLGLHALVPAYLTVLASVLILVFGIFTAGDRIFGRAGYALLASMPLHAESIVLSRFVAMYVEDLLLCLLIFLPSGITYAVLTAPALSFYVFGVLGVLCIPLLPSVVSILFGTLVLAISSRVKRKSMVQTLLSLGILLAALACSFLPMLAGEGLEDRDYLAKLAALLGSAFSVGYPPAVWLGSAMTEGDLLSFLLFAGTSLVLFAATVGLTVRLFSRIVRALFAVPVTHTDTPRYPMRRLSPLRAMYLREMRRYFASSVYVTNTICGPVLAAGAAIVLFFVGADALASVLVGVDVEGAVPLALSAVFCMMPPSCTSVSMEGKQILAIKSYPLSAKTWLDAKLLWSLTLFAPFYAVSEIFLMFALKPHPISAVRILLFPPLLFLLSAVLGITVDLQFRNFDWTKEETVVKQSMSAFLGGFFGPVLSMLLIALFFVTPAMYGDLVRLAVCVLLALSAWLLYRRNQRVSLALL